AARLSVPLLLLDADDVALQVGAARRHRGRGARGAAPGAALGGPHTTRPRRGSCCSAGAPKQRRRAMRKTIAIVAGVLVLALANWTVAERERQLAEGRGVLLPPRPRGGHSARPTGRK